MESINHLPTEVLCKIFSYVPNHGAISRVCQQWKEVSDASKVYEYTKFLDSRKSEADEEYILASSRRYQGTLIKLSYHDNASIELIVNFLQKNRMTMRNLYLQMEQTSLKHIFTAIKNIDNLKTLNINFLVGHDKEQYEVVKLPSLTKLELSSYERDFNIYKYFECPNLENIKIAAFMKDLIGHRDTRNTIYKLLLNCKKIKIIRLGKHFHSHLILACEELSLSIGNLTDIDFENIWSIIKNNLENVKTVNINSKTIPNWFMQKITSSTPNAVKFKISCDSFNNLFTDCFAKQVKVLDLRDFEANFENVRDASRCFPNIQIFYRTYKTWEPHFENYITASFPKILKSNHRISF